MKNILIIFTLIITLHSSIYSSKISKNNICFDICGELTKAGSENSLLGFNLRVNYWVKNNYTLSIYYRSANRFQLPLTGSQKDKESDILSMKSIGFFCGVWNKEFSTQASVKIGPTYSFAELVKKQNRHDLGIGFDFEFVKDPQITLVPIVIIGFYSNFYKNYSLFGLKVGLGLNVKK